MMKGGEALARSKAMAGRIQEKFGLDQDDAEFVVLVGRNGGLFLADQADTWRRARGLRTTGTNIWRWIKGVRDKLGAAFIKEDNSIPTLPSDVAQAWLPEESTEAGGPLL